MAVKALGKGLSALLEEDAPEVKLDGAELNARILMVPPVQLRPGPYQPREIFDQDKINELADSIKANGMIQPIIVRSTEREGIYQIIAGERRWRACKLVGIEQIPVIVREVSNKEAMEIALIENIQRQNLTPIEEADGYRRLQSEFNYTQETLASGLGKSRSHIANMLRLLELPEDVKSYINSGALSMGHARAIVTSKFPSEIAKEVIDKGLSVRETEKFAAGYVSKKEKNKISKKEKNAEILELENILIKKTGLGISIEENNRGGKVVITYRNMSELNKIMLLLGE